ncbi:MAG: tubulin-like doman-containing protein [Bacillota bacterium]
MRSKNIDIKGIGIGQGGCNILMSGLHVRLFAKGVGINTTVSDLDALDLPPEYKVLCENPENPRRGAGKVPAKGRELVLSRAEDIVARIGSLFEGSNTDVLMTVASLGGGTGTGGAFPVAYKLKEAFRKTVMGLFTLPEDSFSDERTATNVLIAVQELISKNRDTYDSIIFIDNKKVLSRVKAERIDIREVNKRFLYPLAKVLEYIDDLAIIPLTWRISNSYCWPVAVLLTSGRRYRM